MVPSDHMNKALRTERLYETLKGMGLYVCPIYVNDEVDSLHVSVDLPSCSTEAAAEAGIRTPMESTKVVERVGPPQQSGSTVINFPPGV
jgi:hypothetical protein